jgi:hypothetical protein
MYIKDGMEYIIFRNQPRSSSSIRVFCRTSLTFKSSIMRTTILFQIVSTVAITSAAAVARSATWEPSAQAAQKWQIILAKTLSLASPLQPYTAQIWDLDLFETDEATIATLKSMGKIVICYFSAGTSEPNRPDLSGLASSDYGAGLPDWPGERWLNLRSERVLNVMAGRIALAAQKGCDAIDPDNVGKYETQLM